jgi:hypothetical protein
LQCRILRHHTLESYTDALDDGKKDGATNGRVAHCFGTAADSERAALLIIVQQFPSEAGCNHTPDLKPGVRTVKKPAKIAFHGSSFLRTL